MSDHPLVNVASYFSEHRARSRDELAQGDWRPARPQGRLAENVRPCSSSGARKVSRRAARRRMDGSSASGRLVMKIDH